MENSKLFNKSEVEEMARDKMKKMSLWYLELGLSHKSSDAELLTVAKELAKEAFASEDNELHMKQLIKNKLYGLKRNRSNLSTRDEYRKSLDKEIIRIHLDSADSAEADMDVIFGERD